MVYSTVTQTWTEAPPLNHARSACVAAAVDGRIYALAGSDVVESIAPGESEWEEDSQLPEGAQAGAGCVLDGKIYIFGAGGRCFIHANSSPPWFRKRTDFAQTKLRSFDSEL